MEDRWSSYYSRIRLRRCEVRDDDEMETSPYFVEKPKYLESQLKRENNSLRKTNETTITKVKSYRKETDDLLEEANELKADLEEQNVEQLYLEEELETLRCDKKEMSDRNRQLEDINCYLDQRPSETFTQKQETELSLDYTIKSLKQKISALEIKVEHRGREVKELKEVLNDKKFELQDKEKKIMKNGYQVCILEETLKKRDELIICLQRQILHHEEEIARHRIELMQMCERNKILKNTVNVKDDQLIKTRIQQQQSLKTLREKEKETDEIVTSRNKRIQHLGTEIEHRDLKIRELEVMLAHEKTENEKANALRKDIREKDDMIWELKGILQQTVSNARKTEAVMKDNIMSLQKRIQQLEIQVQRCELEGNDVNERQMNNDLKEKDDQISDLKDQLKKSRKITHQPKPETKEFIESLNKKIQHLDTEVERLNLQVKDKEEIVGKKTIKLTKTYDRIKVLQNKLNDKDDQLCKAKTEMQQTHKKEAEFNGIVTSMNKKIRYLEIEGESRDKTVKNLEEVLAYEKSRNRKGSYLSKEIREKADRITELKNKLEQTLTQLKKTETELDDTKTRLSNPNITDLSDKNRPTKLAERYAELYDNQWTDAFDILHEHFHSEGKMSLFCRYCRTPCSSAEQREKNNWKI